MPHKTRQPNGITSFGIGDFHAIASCIPTAVGQYDKDAGELKVRFPKADHDLEEKNKFEMDLMKYANVSSTELLRHLSVKAAEKRGSASRTTFTNKRARKGTEEQQQDEPK